MESIQSESAQAAYELCSAKDQSPQNALRRCEEALTHELEGHVAGRVQILRGWALWALGHPSQAADAWIEATKTLPDDIPLRFGLGLFLHDAIRRDEAKMEFQKAVELGLDLQSFDSLENLIAGYGKAWPSPRHTARALEHLSAALEAAGRADEAFGALLRAASIFEQDGAARESRRARSSALRILPTTKDAQLALASLFHEPADLSLYRTLGVGHTSASDALRMCIDHMNERSCRAAIALGLDPLGEARAWTTIGQLPPPDLDDPKPEECYRAAIAAMPDYALAHYLLALYIEPFEPELSMEHRRIAMELRPDWGAELPEPTRHNGSTSGFLISFCDGPDEPTCRTNWLTPSHGFWKVEAEGPGVVVPRQEGFWRVGVRPPQEKQWFDWRLWAAPANDVLEYPRAPGELDGIWDGDRSVVLRFVGPTHVSVEDNFATHGPGISYNRLVEVVSLDDLTERFTDDLSFPGVSIGDALGETAERALSLAVEVEAGAVGGETSPEFLLDTEPDWWVVRGRGRWEVTGRVGYGTGVRRGYFADFAVPALLPTSFTGPDRLPLPWEVIMEAVPDATDAFGSPDGDILVVLTRRVLVYRVREGALGELLLATEEIADYRDVVLAQWATGDYVARWTPELRRLLSP